MDILDILRILKNGAEKPKDDLNDYTKGKRDGQVQAYSHAWTLVKNLSISAVSNRRELLMAFALYVVNEPTKSIDELIIDFEKEHCSH